MTAPEAQALSQKLLAVLAELLDKAGVGDPEHVVCDAAYDLRSAADFEQHLADEGADSS